jgi:hypothetical protein
VSLKYTTKEYMKDGKAMHYVGNTTSADRQL